MLYERPSGPMMYIVDNTTEQIIDGLVRMKNGIKAYFKHEREGVGRIVFDSDKLTEEILQGQIRAGVVDLYDEEAQAKQKVLILGIIDKTLHKNNDWFNKKIIPYRSEESMIRSAGIFPCVYCDKVFTADSSDNPELDLRNHMHNSNDHRAKMKKVLERQ